MSIVINPISDHELYEVNGKEIYKDSNGNWIAREEFTAGT
jgi:phage terminase large subunit